MWEGREDGLAYVCRNYACRAPAATTDELVERLEAERMQRRAEAS